MAQSQCPIAPQKQVRTQIRPLALVIWIWSFIGHCVIGHWSFAVLAPMILPLMILSSPAFPFRASLCLFVAIQVFRFPFSQWDLFRISIFGFLIFCLSSFASCAFSA